MRVTRMVVCLMLAAISTMAAQSNPQTREGFTISFGAGSGSAEFTCDGCSSTRQGSLSDYLRIGGTLSPSLVLAGEINAWTKTENGGTTTIGTVNLVAQWYPAVTSGFYVIGGLGIGTMTLETDNGVLTTSEHGSGGGYQIGAGYDWRVGKNFSLTPFANYFGTSGIKFQGSQLDGNVLSVGLGFTWH